MRLYEFVFCIAEVNRTSLLSYAVFLLTQFNGSRTTVSRVSHTFAWRTMLQ